jgi:hypothetical protein
LLSAERKPKLDPNTLREINSRPAKAVPSEIMATVMKDEIERRRRESQRRVEQGS